MPPANSAVTALPRLIRSAEPQDAQHRRAPADLIDDVVQQRELGLGQHEVVPAGGRLDPPRQRVQPGTGLGAAGRPQAPGARAGVRDLAGDIGDHDSG